MRPALFLLLLPTLLFAGTVRKVFTDETAVATIHTAPGLSTILLFDSRPSAAILGDQDAFKVEYVGQSLTVKPLLPGAKTNLFVFLEYDRFNFTLVSGTKAQADYLVKVQARPGKEAPRARIRGEGASDEPRPAILTTQTVNRSATRSDVTLSVLSVSSPESNSSLIVRFSVRYHDRKGALTLGANCLRLTQKGSSIPLQSHYLDVATLHPRQRDAHGTLVVRQEHVSPAPLTLSLETRPGAPPVQVSFAWKKRK